MYKHIAALQQLRAKYPALPTAAKSTGTRRTPHGLYAFSRLGTDNVEYLVIANNATTAKSATIPTYGPNTWLKPVYGGSKAVKTDREGRVVLTQAPLSVTVYQAVQGPEPDQGASGLHELARARCDGRRSCRDRRRCAWRTPR